MDVIDRYIYAVTNQLPDSMKDDVASELRANIEDMLPEDFAEEDVYRVLEQLGNPWKIAEDYQSKQRYLIGPVLYEQYVSVLKLVIGITATMMFAITLLGWIVDSPNDGYVLTDYAALALDIVISVFHGLLQAAFWVTLIFFAIERGWFGSDVLSLPEKKESWSIQDLPPVPPESHKKIPRSSTIISIVLTIGFTLILYFRPDLIAIHMLNDGTGYTSYPIIELARLHAYLPMILLMALLQLALFVWKFIAQNWSLRLAVAHTILNVLNCLLLVIMLHDEVLFDTLNMMDAAQIFSITHTELQGIWTSIVMVVTVASILITIWDSADAIIKSIRRNH